ncbi:MAG: L-histidine N(alpha)-methyltransferase, partial [Bacteroidota bacterium]
MATVTLTRTETQFAHDIEQGLSNKPKKLSSKYFYDAKGDELFQQIMSMDEYYLTDCEFEILST